MKASAPPTPLRCWRALGRCLPLLAVLAACAPADPVPSTEAQAVRQAVQALGSRLLTGPETPVDPSTAEPGRQSQAVVAAGPDMYFVVWVQHRDEDPPDLRGRRFRASDGVPLDAAPLVLSTDFLEEWPSVIFDGTNFLVSWYDETRYFNTRGMRVRASDGVLLDPVPLNLTSTDYYQSPATVSFDGTNYLATYNAMVYDAADESVAGQALVNRIRPSDGALLDSHSIPVGVMGHYRDVFHSHAAGHAGTSLVAWAGAGYGVRAARVNSMGQVLDTVPLTLSTSGADMVRVAARPGGFLVVWNEGADLKARRVRASDGALLDASALSVGASAELLFVDHWPDTPFDVKFDGQDYRVLWQTTQPERQLMTTRVAPDGTLGADAQTVLGSFNASMTPDWVGFAAQGPGRFLVAYAQWDGARNRIQFQRVGPNTCYPDVPPLVVGPETPVNASTAEPGLQSQSVVAAGPDMYFAVWVQDRGENPPDLRGRRFRASDGVPLDAAPLVLSTDFLDEWPSVAFDGTNFLVSWFDHTQYFNTRGMRVRASDGALLDPAPLRLTTTEHYIQWPATLSFDGTNYLATYRAIVANPYDGSASFQTLINRIRPADGALVDAEAIHVGVMGDPSAVFHSHAASHAGTTLVAWAGDGDGVRAARVGPMGQVLDTVPLTVSTLGASKVRVAARPGGFLVVWNEGGDLKARRVRASDGALLDASALSVGASAELLYSSQWPQTPFDVAFDGQDYRVLWQSTQPARRLMTTRVASDGTVGADAQDVLATFNASTAPDWVGLAAQGPGSFLVTHAQRDAGPNRIQFRRIHPDSCDPAQPPAFQP